jgi:hypothetical protein
MTDDRGQKTAYLTPDFCLLTPDLAEVSYGFRKTVVGGNYS